MVEFFDQLISAEASMAGLAVLSLAFIVGSLLFVPRHLLCVIGGLTFGWYAIPVALLGSTAGAVIAFLMSRHLFQTLFLRMTNQRPVWKATVAAIDREGWRLVGLVRLASPLPGAVTNYIFGLTRIRLLPYAAATCVGIFPSVVLFVYLGTLGRMAFDQYSGSWLQWLATIAGFVVTIVVTILVTRQAKLALAER